MALKAKDLVTAPVSTVRPDTPLPEVVRAFIQDAVECIPVLTQTREIAGLITERQILKIIASNGNFHLMTAGEAIIRNPLIVDGEVLLSEIQNALVIGFRTGILVTENGKFSGMIGKSALLKLFCTDTDGSDALAFVVDTTRALLSSKSRRQVLKILVEKIGKYFNAKRCSVISVDEMGERALVLSTSEDPSLTNLPIDLNKHPEIKEAYVTGMPVVLKNAVDSPLLKPARQWLKKIDIKDIIVFPIVSRDKVVGTLHLRTQTKKSFTDQEIKVAEMLASIAAEAIRTISREENMETLYKDYEHKAIIDDLTGLYNRRFLTKRLKEEFGLARRHGMPLACILFDIDYFKDINDKFGHEKGDCVLKILADFLRTTIRVSDVIVRYGGEEFLLLLPVTDEEGALREAERIQRALADLDCGLGRKKITVSMGVAAFPFAGVTKPEDLIKNADSAMYEGKRSGRNCTIVYSSIGGFNDDTPRMA